jgi:crossover junction endodeoxyribonuclease RusA
MRARVRFFAKGIPATQGSKKLVRLRNARTVMLESCKRLPAWRDAVAAAALAAQTEPMFIGDVELRVVCRWPRPASHMRRDGTPRAACPERPRYADCDKLARAICDALSGVVYRDDRQVASLSIERVWARNGDPAGAHIEVIDLSDASTI